MLVRPRWNVTIAIWLCLCLALIYYIATILGPFFVLGIYRMSRPELWNSPIPTGEEVTGTQCCLSWLLIIPLFCGALLDLRYNWRRLSHQARVWKLVVVSAALVIIMLSLFYGKVLSFWAIDSW